MQRETAPILDRAAAAAPRRGAALLIVLLGGTPALAQTTVPERADAFGLPSDIKAYITAPLRAERRQWTRFAVAAGAVALAYGLDNDVREHFDATIAPAGQKPDTNDTAHALPAAFALAGTWAAAALLDDDDGRREARAMLKAAAFSGVATLALKEVVGRARPYQSADKNAWDGGDSFPSQHASAAFAIGTVLAESGNDRHRWLRRTLGYGIGAWTIYARVDDNVHWLSDTVAGAAIGVATARFIMRRDAAGRRGALLLTPTSDGVHVSYTVSLR